MRKGRGTGMSWSAVIVFAALLTAAVVVVTGYFRGNRKIQAAADAARADTPLTLLPPEAQPSRRQVGRGPGAGGVPRRGRHHAGRQREDVLRQGRRHGGRAPAQQRFRPLARAASQRRRAETRSQRGGVAGQGRYRSLV